MRSPRHAAVALLLGLAACATEPPVPPPAPVEVARLPPEVEKPPLQSPFGEDQLICLALTIYWEGRSESRAGQVAIAHVVLNRVKDPRFPRTICGVVKEGGHRPRGGCQFSWWCDGKSDIPTEAAQWATAQKIAREESLPDASDPTGGSLYFHNGRVKPVWTRWVTRTGAIGQHTFYR